MGRRDGDGVFAGRVACRGGEQGSGGFKSNWIVWNLSLSIKFSMFPDKRGDDDPFASVESEPHFVTCQLPGMMCSRCSQPRTRPALTLCPQSIRPLEPQESFSHSILALASPSQPLLSLPPLFFSLLQLDIVGREHAPEPLGVVAFPPVVRHECNVCDHAALGEADLAVLGGLVLVQRDRGRLG